MRVTTKHLHYNVNVALLCEDCAAENIKKNVLHKVAEERYFKLGKMIYIDISSQKKPIYGGYNNWILIKGSDAK